MTTDVTPFYRAIADEYGCADCNAAVADPRDVAQHLWNKAHPIQTCTWIGPTRPGHSMSIFDQVLRDGYAPGLRAALDESNPLWQAALTNLHARDKAKKKRHWWSR